MEKRKLVYVAGPYTGVLGNSNVITNARNACEWGDKIWDMGYAIIVPHWNAIQEFCGKRRPYEDWMAIDDQILQRCDILFRIPGASNGADAEVKRARELGIPVFDDLEKLAAYKVFNGEEAYRYERFGS